MGDIAAETVLRDHYFDGASKATRLRGGAVNATYLVEHDAQKYIMQHMNPMFSAAMSTDFAGVTQHLQGQGWEVPQLIKTRDDRLYVEDGDSWWRLMTFIESDGGVPTELSLDDYLTIGALLARLHVDLASYDRELAYTLPHYHDTEYYKQRLQAVMNQLPSELLAKQASATLQALVELPELPTAQQLTHADPQTVNVLFRNGKPFTFIDYDTLMQAGVWIDIGDMLRSVVEDALEAGRSLPVGVVQAVLAGYYQVFNAGQTKGEFVQSCLVGVELIALQLSMRFLTDIVEDSYFDYDPAKFTSRRSYNEHRALMQWKIFIMTQELRHDNSITL